MCRGGIFIQAGGSLSGVITNSDLSCSAMILQFVAATVSSERWEVAESQMDMNVFLAMATTTVLRLFFLIMHPIRQLSFSNYPHSPSTART